MHSRTVLTRAVVLATALSGAVAAAAAAEPITDWPQFRGPARDGISAADLLDSWTAEGPTEVWRRPLGEGYSEPSVAGGRIYTGFSDATPWDTARQEPAGEELLAAFDAATGEEIWRAKLGHKTFTEFGHGPRSTPTVDGDTVFMLSGQGRLAAFAASDGSERWAIDLAETFGSPQIGWGHSTSALVEDGIVILDVGGPDGKSYAGLSRTDGKVLWTTGEAGRGGAGYGSALPVEIAGERQLVYVTGRKLRSISNSGTLLWEVDWPRGETHAMPVLIPPDMIFGGGAGDVGSLVHRIVKGEDGYQVEEVWRSSVLKNHFSSSVYHDGHLYGFDNATFKCIDARTGEQKWAKRGLGKGSLILADGKLLVLSDRGKLLLVEATPSGYVEKGAVQAMEGKCWTAPVLAGGRLYLRNHEEMVAYQVGG